MSFTCALTIVLAGCGETKSKIESFFNDPSGEPIKATIRTTVPLAYAASVAMASVNGHAPSNASTSKICSSTPCSALVTIAVDNSTLPMQFAKTGNVLVYVYLSSPDQALLTVVFWDFPAGSSFFPVYDISVFPVEMTANGLRIVYASMDINVSTGPVDPGTLTQTQIDAAFLKFNITASGDASVNEDMDAWIVDVDDAGTPYVFSDDKYTIAGGGVYVDASSGSAMVLELGMIDTTMRPDCALNPAGGVAAMNELGGSSSSSSSGSTAKSGTALITFEPDCDGNAKVSAGTGSYIMSIGKSIPLNLTTP